MNERLEENLQYEAEEICRKVEDVDLPPKRILLFAEKDGQFAGSDDFKCTVFGAEYPLALLPSDDLKDTITKIFLEVSPYPYRYELSLHLHKISLFRRWGGTNSRSPASTSSSLHQTTPAISRP